MKARLCTKFPHRTNESAQRELARILRRGERLERLHIYPCQICKALHVGHKKGAIPVTDRLVPLRPAARERIPADIRAMLTRRNKRHPQT